MFPSREHQRALGMYTTHQRRTFHERKNGNRLDVETLCTWTEPEANGCIHIGCKGRLHAKVTLQRFRETTFKKEMTNMNISDHGQPQGKQLGLIAMFDVEIIDCPRLNLIIYRVCRQLA